MSSLETSWKDNAMAERILVVEHEEAVRKIVVSMLSSAGYECHEAADGLEALTLLDSGKEFGLVLSGLVMPNLDGISLLERVKEKYPDTSFVIVTAVRDVSVVLAVRSGAYDYLLKPFEREQLLNTVNRALENRRLKMENRIYQKNLESQLRDRADLERSFDATIQSLGDALDFKQGSTGGHSKRVTAFSMGIARGLGIPQEQVAIIARGAFLHDIGKMAIPDKILLKPGDLTSEETAIMQEHCFKGYQIVRKIPFLVPEPAEIVYAHHERYDGSGYPGGLAGKQIPFGARIVAIANALDSITSNLPYRAARSLAVARKEIQEWSGRQFDPEIVTVFQQMPDEIFEELRRAIGPKPNGNA